MKKFIVNVLIFCFFASMIYAFLIFFFGAYAPKILSQNLFHDGTSSGFTKGRLNDINKLKSVDLLVLGSSHAYRHYDPRIFSTDGITMFTTGTSAQSPIQTEYIVKKYLENLKPKLVIFDVFPLLMRDTGIESSLDLINNDNIDFKTLKMVFRVNNLKIYNSFLYEVISRLLHIKKQLRSNIVSTDKYIKGGYVETYRQYKSGNEMKSPKDIEILDVQLDAINRIVKIFASRNIKVVLIQSPSSPMTYNSFINNKELDKTLASIGLPYYNFNKLVKIPQEYFYDETHLNQNGTTLFNLKLLEILQKDEYLNFSRIKN